MSLFKTKERKITTIRKAIKLAMPLLPNPFYLYPAPRRPSLVKMVRTLSGRDFVSDSTIARILRMINEDEGWQYVKNIDRAKGLYEKI